MSNIIKCPRCNGSKTEPIDKAMGIFSLGITALIEWAIPQECSMCDGKGLVRCKESDYNLIRMVEL